MKRSMLWVGFLLGASGCNLVVGPKVQCPTDHVAIKVKQTATSQRSQPCVFADPYPFTISYSPHVVPATTANGAAAQYSYQNDRNLVGGQVTVTQGSAATLLCGTVSDVCQSGQPSIVTTISPSGVLSYQGLFTLEPLGVILTAGDSFTWTGVLATEEFGPGNSCDVTASIDLACQAPQ